GGAYAWLHTSRQVAAVAPVDNPMSIYINAAHQEDIQYMDLSDIDMERERPNGTRYNYQDFVFTVQGEYIRAFRLQLAYTTNNQITFEIYQAEEDPNGDVLYVSAEDGSSVYYSADGGALPLTYLNAQSGNKLANNTLHTDTYGSYNNVNLYAEPIYCQTTNTIAVRHREGIRFHNYFILRATWPAERTNDKETDIIYIAAKAAG
ncbi:MAG: hypothetical protein IKN53_05620, partial [Oscillibacter sp.]|nr:hypothetical protein [Oscillibacter sp.]